MFQSGVKISYDEVLALLNHFSKDFFPPLDEECDISEYARKLSSKAVFEVYIEGNIICGYIAYYLNTETKVAYITSVAVDRVCRGKGIGKQLLSNLETYVLGKCNKLRLEVAKQSIPALKLYQSCGFIEEEDRNVKYLMIKEL